MRALTPVLTPALTPARSLGCAAFGLNRWPGRLASCSVSRAVGPARVSRVRGRPSPRLHQSSMSDVCFAVPRRAEGTGSLVSAVVRCCFLMRVWFVSPLRAAGWLAVRPEGEVGPVGQDRVEASESPAAPRQPPPSVRCVRPPAGRRSLDARARVRGRSCTRKLRPSAWCSHAGGLAAPTRGVHSHG